MSSKFSPQVLSPRDLTSPSQKQQAPPKPPKPKVFTGSAPDSKKNPVPSAKTQFYLDNVTSLEFSIDALENSEGRFLETTKNALHQGMKSPTDAGLTLNFQERIQSEVRVVFHKIRSQKIDINPSPYDATLMTTHPEDMFNVMHAQLYVTTEKLPPEFIKEVAVACFQVLQDFQRTSYDFFENAGQTRKREMDLIALSAFINDNQRMADKCYDFLSEVLKALPPSFDADEAVLKAMTNEIAREYALIVDQAILLLCRCILTNLEDRFYIQLFTPQWEYGNNNEHIMTNLIKRVREYCEDFKLWLTFPHYVKFMKELLYLLVGHYIMAIRKKVHGIFSFVNESIVSNKIMTDRSMLFDFYRIQFKEILKKDKNRKKSTSSVVEAVFDISIKDQASNKENRSNKSNVNSKNILSNNSREGELSPLLDNLELVLNEAFAPVNCFARIIASPTVELAETDAKKLFLIFGIDGLKVVQSCFLLNPCIPFSERLTCGKIAQKLFDDHNINHIYSTEPIEDYKQYDDMASTPLIDPSVCTCSCFGLPR
jgi:hypothetical protein